MLFVFSKAQAAMEFLMTYGWAILVVLVVIGALAYFGVLSPSTLLPEKCTFEVSVDCIDFSVGDDGVSVVLQNSAGRDMKVTGISFTSGALSGVCDSVGMDAVLRNGQKATFFSNDPAACSFVNTGRDKNKYGVIVTYSWLDSAIEHDLEGELLARYDGGVIGGDGGFGGGSGSLVGFWRFDVDENPTRDSSGNGNDGSVVGATWQDADCHSGGCYTFDGVNDYVSYSNPNINADFTLGVWEKMSVAPNYWRGILTLGGSHSSGGTTMHDGRFLSDIQASGVSIEGDCTIGINYAELFWNKYVNTGEWSHIAVTYDSATKTFRTYINGQYKQYCVHNGVLDRTGTEFSIGKQSTAQFNGNIDEVMIYSRALSEGEIAALAGN